MHATKALSVLRCNRCCITADIGELLACVSTSVVAQPAMACSHAGSNASEAVTESIRTYRVSTCSLAAEHVQAATSERTEAREEVSGTASPSAAEDNTDQEEQLRDRLLETALDHVVCTCT